MAEPHMKRRQDVQDGWPCIGSHISYVTPGFLGPQIFHHRGSTSLFWSLP